MTGPATDKKGFTLIELSMVLIIIGLVAGGVLLGKDLIFAAQVRQQVSQIHQFDAAALTFKNKYNCLPGDCAAAIDFGLGIPGGAGDYGNNDGIYQRDPDSTIGPEILDFWYHLSLANLIAHPSTGFTGAATYMPGVDTPALKLQGENWALPTVPPFQTAGHNPRGGMWILTIDEQPDMVKVDELFNYESMHKHVWFLANDSGPTDLRYGLYYAWRAYSLDGKIDDGMPLTGVMRARPYKMVGDINYGDNGGLWSCIAAEWFWPGPENDDIYNWEQGIFDANSSGCVIFIRTQF